MKFQIEKGHPFFWTTTVEVKDEPVASSLDAMQRESDLRTLSEEKARLEKQWRESGGRFKVRRKTLSRLSKAMELLSKHLAVWQVQDE